MAIDEKKFQPGQVSTDIIRGTTKSLKVVSKIDSATTIASKSQNISANNRDSRTGETSDLFSSETNLLKLKKAEEKRNLEAQIKDKNIKEMTAQEHITANKKAQSLILYLIKQAYPVGLSFFERSKQISSSTEQALEIAREDFERLQENPSKILQVALNVVPRKLAEAKNFARREGDLEKSAYLEKVDEILGQIFDVMEQVSGQGSHTALLNLIESLNQSEIKNELHQLILDYHKSLEKLGKQIQRANAQLLNRTRHPHSELITGIQSKMDKGLRTSIYTRPESLGAALRDHFGGILGGLYDYLDTEWSFGSNPWEYSQQVKNERKISTTPFPIRRLAGEMRGYIGMLTEEQPGPMFVTTDVEAKTPLNNKRSKKKSYFDRKSKQNNYDEDFDEDDDNED